jgi:hypothetical protein
LPAELLVIVATALALAVVPRATPAPTPLLDLGPITVANDTAVLTGTVGSQAAGSTLTVNGQPLAVDASGHFAGTVSVAGAGSLELVLTSPAGETRTQFTIPLSESLLSVGGVIPGDVLDSLLRAGVTLLKPLGGGNVPLTVAGSVLDKRRLAGLTINGIDVLGVLGQGGAFSLKLAGTTRTISVTATDTHGVSQTTVTRSPLTLGRVSAANAVGVRITGIRYVTRGVLRTHRVRMIVTVTDSRGVPIQGAKISVRGTKARPLARRPQVAISGPKGRATVTLLLRRAALGKRLVTITVAKTPSATARKTTSVRIPRARSRS